MWMELVEYSAGASSYVYYVLCNALWSAFFECTELNN